MSKYTVLKITIIFLVFFPHKITYAQIKSNFYISPNISIGYVLKTGFIYGFDITLGVFKINNYIHPTSLAISTKYKFLNTSNDVNRIFSFNFVAENDFTKIGAGFGEIKRKWGYKKKNVFKTYAFITDIGFYSGIKYTPWIGVCTIHPHIKAEWFGKKPLIGYYTYFKQENIEILKN